MNAPRSSTPILQLTMILAALIPAPTPALALAQDQKSNAMPTVGVVHGATNQTAFDAPPAVPLPFSPAARDADGRFVNGDPAVSEGNRGVNIGFMLRRFGTLFRSGRDAPERVANDGQFLRSNTKATTVTWIGHATVLLQMQGMNVLTDPIWSNTPSPVRGIGPSRFVPPGLNLEDLPRIDVVVISHNHYDHLDLPTLRALHERNPDTRFLVPLGNAELLRKEGISTVHALDWGEHTGIGPLRIYCLPAQHWSKRGLTDTRKALWASWAIVTHGSSVYFAGDTGYFDGFRQIGAALGPFDLAIMPIGAYAPRQMMELSHLNPEEAIQAANDIGARVAMGVHFGTFDLSDEPLEEPPQRFQEAAKSTALGLGNAWVLKIGETRQLAPPSKPWKHQTPGISPAPSPR